MSKANKVSETLQDTCVILLLYPFEDESLRSLLNKGLLECSKQKNCRSLDTKSYKQIGKGRWVLVIVLMKIFNVPDSYRSIARFL